MKLQGYGDVINGISPAQGTWASKKMVKIPKLDSNVGVVSF